MAVRNRTSFSERRRLQLARRVAALDSLEKRNLVTDPLGLASMSIGLASVPALLGALDADASQAPVARRHPAPPGTDLSPAAAWQELTVTAAPSARWRPRSATAPLAASRAAATATDPGWLPWVAEGRGEVALGPSTQRPGRGGEAAGGGAGGGVSASSPPITPVRFPRPGGSNSSGPAAAGGWAGAGAAASTAPLGGPRGAPRDPASDGEPATTPGPTGRAGSASGGQPPIMPFGPGDFQVVAATQGNAAEPATTGYLRIHHPYGQTATTSVRVYYTVAGSATPGLDYVPLPGFLDIAAGSSGGLIPVVPIDDAVDEITEMVEMTIVPGGGYEIFMGASTSSINLIDDDAPLGGTLGNPGGGAGGTGGAGGDPGNGGPHEDCESTASFTLSTLDYNHGNVLMLNDVRPAYLGGAVDLRAQVGGASGASYTYSWGTNGLTGRANSISGASTARLTFQWNTTNTGDATTVSVPLTVTKNGTESVTQTYYFYVPKTSPAAPSVPTWPATVAPDQVGRDAYAFESYQVLVGAQTGALMTSLTLPSYNPNVAPLVFEYDSLSADPRPIVLARRELTGTLPTKISASMSLNGQSTASYYYDTQGLIAGDFVQIALQNTNLPGTGRYSYTVTVVEDRGGTLTTVPYTGTTAVVNESASAFGAGWTLRDFDRLVTGLSGGVLLNVGQGDSLWFSGAGPTYASPSGDFTTLAYDAGSATYTRTHRGGEKQVFDSAGKQTAWVDREGLRTTYSYSGNLLQTILDPYNNRTTFTYDGSGKLSAVQDPASRRTTFTVAGGTLGGVQLPDQGRVTYAYDAAKRLTTLTNQRNNTSVIAYDAAGRVGTVTRPDGGVETFTAVQTRGWLAAGGNSGSPAPPTLLAAAKATRVNSLGHAAAVRTDWNGKGLANQTTDEQCRVATSNLLPNGLPGAATDRRGWLAWYAHDARGNLTRATDANLAVDTYTYTADDYANLATHTDPMGRTTSYSYDAKGNPSLVVDALGHRTTIVYTYSSNRVASVAVTDARSHTTTFAYDVQERLTTVTHPGGATTKLAYDSYGNAATVVDERGNATTSSYDAMNRMTGVKDALGNRVTYAYDAGGNLVGVAAPLSRAVSYAYDPLDRLTTMVRQGTGTVLATTVHGYDSGGNLTSTTDPDGRTTQYAYDAADRLTTLTDAGGGVTRFAYDSKGNLATLTDARGNVTTYGYDPVDRLTKVSAPLSRVTTYARQANGQVTRVTAPLGRVTTLAYDGLGRLAAVTDPAGQTTAYGYDAVDNLATLTDARGNVTAYGYDARDRLTTVTAPLARVTTFAYDAASNLVGWTDPLGRRATVAYDALNRATTVTDPLTRNTVTAFDAAGRATTVTNANGETTVTAYDAADRVTTVVRQGTGTVLATTAYSYSAGDDLLVRTDPNGNRTTLAYDALHRLTTITAPLSRVTTLAYDLVGNLTGQTDPNGNRTTYAYDAADRLTTITAPLARVATRAYDAADRLVGATDPLGLTTTHAYDAADRLTTLTNARGDVTRFTYDANGNLTVLTDPGGNRTTYAYDAADRVTTVTDALGTATYVYDAADQLTDRTDRQGRRVTLAYDAGGRMTHERWLSGGATVRQLTYAYDYVGRVTGAADPDATLTFAYDGAGRLTTAATAGTGGGQTALTLTYAFDAGDRRTGLVDSYGPSVGRTTYQYDAADRLTTLTRSHNGVAGPRVILGYDAGDRITAIARTINGTGTAVRSTLAYDAADRVTTIQHGRVVSGTPTPLATYVYAYDKNDRLTTETINGAAVTYTYDNAGQLTAAGGARTESYGYDSGGNRNTTGYSTIAGNRLTASPGYTSTYDADGNLATRTEVATGEVMAYAYDHRNRLTGVTRTAADGTLRLQVTYTYDPLDRRIGTAAASAANGPIPFDPGFEVPDLGTGFQYRPAGSAWTFAGNSGLAANGSAFTVNNPNAPEGDQVALLQGTSTMTQSVAAWAEGTYVIRFDAAQRNFAGNNQIVEVRVDGTLVGTIHPSGTSYVEYATAPFTVAGGTHTIELRGAQTPGDHTALVDDLRIEAVAPTPANAGFETPDQGTGFQYTPSGASWTFTASAGLAGNGSAFTVNNPNAPEGDQVAFLQNVGVMSQSIAGWAEGTYVIRFDAAQRNWPGSNQTVEVRVGGTLVGTINPSGTSYAEYATAPFAVAAGTHTVELRGLGPGGDHTALVDDLRIERATPTPANTGFETPDQGSGFQYAPSGASWTFTGNAGLAGNGSAFTVNNPNAPEGDQVAFLQGSTGTMSQSVTAWAAGTYVIRFDAAQRNFAGNNQIVEVRVGGTLVGTIHPSGTSYAEYATAPFTVAAGTHTVELRGIQTPGDHTALIDDLRIERVLGPAQRTWTVYDGVNPYADFDGSGALQTRYLHGPAIDELLARTRADGTTAWYLPDRLGSIRDIASTAGTIVYHAEYDSFGQVLTESGTGGDRFKYTGREYDAALDLYDSRARVYDPVTGRFLQRDPIGFAGGDANLYRYVGNSPTNAVDPMGLQAAGPGDGQRITQAGRPHQRDDGGSQTGRRNPPTPRWYDAPGYRDPNAPPWYNDDWTDWINPRAYAAGLAAHFPQRGYGLGQRIGAAYGELANLDPDTFLAVRAAQQKYMADQMAFLGPASEGEITPERFARERLGAMYGGLVTDTAQPVGRIVDGAVATGELSAEVAGIIAVVGGIRKPNGATIPWSSPEVRAAGRRLREGATEIHVADRSQAEELFLRVFQGDGYKNTTGWPPSIVKEYGKLGTYHWDEVFEEGSNVLQRHYDDGRPHNYVPHLQIHAHDGRIIRILFNK